MTEQPTLFDFIQPEPKTRRKLEPGQTVTVRFYDDEIEYVQQHCPVLLEVGTIIEKRMDFWLVRFGECEHVVEGKKLKLV